MKKNSIIATAMVLITSLACLTGCSQSTAANTGIGLASGGVLYLSVNPEIAVNYDDNGNVTKVEARNDDGNTILADYSGYKGKAARQVVTELVTAIGKAGYFVEEVDGEKRQITLEIESGSRLPHDAFLDEVVSDVRNCINSNNWHSPIDVKGESDYGITDYTDTDYGPDSDGVTDYDDTDYGPGSDGVTDYNDTDYGPGSDGVTDYDDTDYGPGSDGVTDYDDTDYGPNSDGVTDYDDTDYGPDSDGVTDYDDTDDNDDDDDDDDGDDDDDDDGDDDDGDDDDGDDD